jgi:hypothetical protein
MQKLTQQQGSPQSQRQQPPPSLQLDQSELLNNMDPARLPQWATRYGQNVTILTAPSLLPPWAAKRR